MRPRPALIAVFAAFALVALAGLLFIASFDVERYKTQLIDAVAARTGRSLSIDGTPSLTLLPRPGLSIGRAQLSGPGGSGEFASVEAAHVRLAIWPLLARRLVIERVVLDHLQIDAQRGHDGHTNFDDLLAPQAAPAAANGGETGGGASPLSMAVATAGIELHDATLRWHDASEGVQWQLSGIELDIDRLASKQPGSLRLSGKLAGGEQAIDLDIEAVSHYTVDLASAAIRLSQLDVRARGNALATQSLDARLKAAMFVVDPPGRRFELSGVALQLRSADGISASFDAPALGLAPDAARGQPIKARLTIDRPGQRSDTRLTIAAPRFDAGRIVFADIAADIDLNHDAMRGKGRIVGSMSLDSSLQRVQWPRWSGNFELTGPALPANGTRLSLQADALIDRTRQMGELSLQGSLDDAPLQLRAHTSRWAPLAIRYDLHAGRFDLDRYGISRDPAAARGSGAAQPAATAQAGGTPAPAAPIGSAAAIRWIGGIETQGTLHIETLKTAGIEIGDFTANVRTGGARIELPEFGAALYRGRLAGNAVITAQGRHGLQLRLADVDAGDALRGLAGRDLLEGRGDFELHVNGTGFSVDAIRRSLDGHARLALREGTLKGLDVPQSLRKLRTLVGSRAVLQQPAETTQHTDFTSLKASFELRDGIAHNHDLDVRSPLPLPLRIGGAGRIDLAQGSLDYLAQASLTGLGSGELTRLRGLAIPIHLSGAFDALSYRIDTGAMIASVLKPEPQSGSRLHKALRSRP
ncbi:MAG: hypothetical protein ABT05_00445 [Lautropia sp. SCN 66-9]|nr:MAG: hypothetical protein ABT05_00445 [Lautropia sp. SCN 66-9]